MYLMQIYLKLKLKWLLQQQQQKKEYTRTSRIRPEMYIMHFFFLNAHTHQIAEYSQYVPVILTSCMFYNVQGISRKK